MTTLFRAFFFAAGLIASALPSWSRDAGEVSAASPAAVSALISAAGNMDYAAKVIATAPGELFVAGKPDLIAATLAYYNALLMLSFSPDDAVAGAAAAAIVEISPLIEAIEAMGDLTEMGPYWEQMSRVLLARQELYRIIAG